MKEHARKIGRVERLLDTFRRAVHMSDPLISMFYKYRRKERLYEKTKWGIERRDE